MSDPVGQIIDLILKSNKILVVPSCPPDGDSIGSALALFEGLQKLDKKVTVVSADPVPHSLQFLPNSNIIGDVIKENRDFIVTLDCNEAQVDKLKYEIVDNKVNIIITPKNGKFSENHVSFKQSGPDFDLVIAVDTADVNQLGTIYENNTDFFYSVPVINIDHHISNSNFGKVNYVDTAAASATEILFGVFKALEQRTQKTLVSDKVATYLLTGILTDTGSFQNPNTTPRSLEVSAELVERGAAQQDIIKHVFRTKELSTLRLWGEILSKIETDNKYKIVWSTVTKSDLAKANAKVEEVSGLIDDMLVNAPGAEIVFIIKEDGDKIACSMRSTTPAANVSEIAEHFGGGGHVQAAGFRFAGADFKSAVEQITSYIKQYQAKRLHLEQTPSENTTQNQNTSQQKENTSNENTQAKPEQSYAQKINTHFLGENQEVSFSPVEKPTQKEEQQTQSSPQVQQQSTTPNTTQQRTGEAGNNSERKKRRRRKKRKPEGQNGEQQKPQRQTTAPQNIEPPRPMSGNRTPKQEVIQEAPQSTPPPPQEMSTPPPAPPAPAPKQTTVVPPPVAPQQQPMQPTPPTPTPQIQPPVQPQTPPQAEPPQPPKPQAAQEEQKPNYDPFNPPNPDESDILAALDKL